MEEKLKAVASTYNIDINILKAIYREGFSKGYDIGYNTSKPELFEPERYYQDFNVEKQKGQKE